MADGDVLGILLLARNAMQCQLAFLPGLHCHLTFSNILEHVCTINARSALQKRCHYVQLQLSPRSSISQPSASSNSVPGSDVCWVLGMKPLKNQTLSKTMGYSAKMIQAFHPNHPTGACHPEILGYPIIGGNPQ